MFADTLALVLNLLLVQDPKSPQEKGNDAKTPAAQEEKAELTELKRAAGKLIFANSYHFQLTAHRRADGGAPVAPEKDGKGKGEANSGDAKNEGGAGVTVAELS